MLLGSAMFSSCSSDNVRSPEYHSEILLDDDLNIVDMGRAGQSTDDSNYYYHGSVTLYDEDGGYRNFPSGAWLCPRNLTTAWWNRS